MESIENQNHRTSFEFSSRMEDRGWICKYANNFRATTTNLVSSGGWRGCSSGGRSHGALARESTLPRSIDEPRYTTTLYAHAKSRSIETDQLAVSML